MAGIVSNYIAGQMNRWLFDAQVPPAIATVYFALFTTAPTAAGGGVEVSAASYARVAVTRGFSFLTNETIAQNLAVILWPTPAESWGTVLALGVYDAATGGNLLFAETFAGIAVDVGQAPKVKAAEGSFTIAAGP